MNDHLCTGCGRTLVCSEFYPDKIKPCGHHSRCKECVKADRKKRYAEDPQKYLSRAQEWAQKNRDKIAENVRLRKRDAMDLYGAKCACCGQEGYQFLTFDHVLGDGAEHRRREGEGATVILNWIKRNGYRPDYLQLLCWNCNCARGIHGHCH